MIDENQQAVIADHMQAAADPDRWQALLMAAIDEGLSLDDAIEAADTLSKENASTT